MDALGAGYYNSFHTTARTLCMHKVCAVVSSSENSAVATSSAPWLCNVRASPYTSIKQYHIIDINSLMINVPLALLLLVEMQV